MDKRQARALLALIADLYLLASEPEPPNDETISEQNGYREVQLVPEAAATP